MALTSGQRVFSVLAVSAAALAIWHLAPVEQGLTLATVRSSTAAANAGKVEERVAMLEDEIQSLRMQLADRHAQGTRGKPAEPPSAEAMIQNDAARNRQFQSRLTTSFQQQPTDHQWAARTKAALEESLIATAAEQSDLPAPDSAQMQCKSTTCRIEARYRDEDSALFGVQLLQTAFSSRLPRSHQYTVSNKDGSVTLVMYASKGPVSIR